MSLAAFALVASPLLAFLGVLLGHRVTRTSARELDRWRKREETMRLLRWATDLAVDTEPARATVGIAVLEELLVAPILDQDDRTLVTTVGTAVARTVIIDEERGQPP
jgi:hypothetical protein